MPQVLRANRPNKWGIFFCAKGWNTTVELEVDVPRQGVSQYHTSFFAKWGRYIFLQQLICAALPCQINIWYCTFLKSHRFRPSFPLTTPRMLPRSGGYSDSTPQSSEATLLTTLAILPCRIFIRVVLWINALGFHIDKRQAAASSKEVSRAPPKRIRALKAGAKCRFAARLGSIIWADTFRVTQSSTGLERFCRQHFRAVHLAL